MINLRILEAEEDQSSAKVETRPQNQPAIPSVPRKGVAHAPAEAMGIDPRTRNTLLQAIVQARGWMDAILDGKVASFEEIAGAENLGVRHIRFLAPLAFLSPRIIEAIANGSIPAGATASSLARALPHAWAEQERGLISQ